MAAQAVHDEQTTGSRLFSRRALLILAGAMVIEGAAIGGVVLLHRGPAEVTAEAVAPAEAPRDRPVEMLLIEDRFQNTRTGRAYTYEAEIYILVPRRHEQTVRRKLEQMHAQVATRIARLFRRAEPAHLLEPELTTLTRQIQAMLDQQLGYDAHGNAYVEQVLIRKCMQFPVS